MILAGVDEVGRGPLAGPVVAAAVILDPSRPIAGLRDSKLLTAAARERLAGELRARAAGWGLGRAEVEEIDQMNILQASLLAMQRALAALPFAPQQILVDGNRCPSLAGLWYRCPIEAVVGGDARIAAISAASILAKTVRDAWMVEAGRDFPGYGFERHKGYPTEDHRRALAALGPCKLHRLSFAPVRSAHAPG
ncbi:MAG: ribonuclease HII [Gammaproteobacteria bacterium]|nr:ribonuclease HII [Gammaproteobacteria bacterium]